MDQYKSATEAIAMNQQGKSGSVSEIVRVITAYRERAREAERLMREYIWRDFHKTQRKIREAKSGPV